MRSLVALFMTTAIACAGLAYGHQTHGASYTPLLALDLEGGTQLILTPVSTDADDRDVTEQDIAEAINVIRQRVDASGVAEAEITSLGSSNIVVALPGNPSKETLDLIRTSSQMVFRPVLQAAPAVELGSHPAASHMGDTTQSAQAPQSSLQAASDNTQSTQATQPTDAAQSVDSAQSAPMKTLALSPEEAKKAADRNGDGKISHDPEQTPSDHSDYAWITEQTIHDFLIADCSQADTRSRAALAEADKAAVACDDTGTLKYILGPVDVSGSQLSSAAGGPVRNQHGQPTGSWGVSLQFDSEGTTAFAEASERLYRLRNDPAQPGSVATRNQFAVVLDGQVITAPRMNQPIPNGQAEITGNFTSQSAAALANQLNFGSLPLNFEVQSEQQISATLGADHLEKGIWAGLIGLALVVVYMMWQYRGLGLLASSSLLVAGALTYLVITLLSWLLGYRLSLSGVAGLIVSVGVTADSFIVYFERIRDEVREGRMLESAVSDAWDRAKRTIIVSDAVNIVAATVLYVLAVGGVQGFAFTLGVTTIVDLIVIFWFTHPMMELAVKIPFFGQGHKLSGLDPEHLGAKGGFTYAGRGRVTMRAPKQAASSGDPMMTIAQRRRQERQKLAQETTESQEAN